MRSSPRGVAVTLSNAAELKELGVVARISGVVEGGEVEPHTELAVAVNGRSER